MRAVNLIPGEQRRGGGGAYGRSDGAAYVLLGFAVGVFALAVVYILAHHHIADSKATAARLSAQAATAQAEASALAPYTSFLGMRDQRAQAVQQLASSRFDWAHAIHEIGRVLPSDVSLTQVNGTIGAAAASTTATTPAPATSTSASASTVTSATPPGSTPSLAISGCTTSQSEVALTMQRLSLIDGVTNVALGSSVGASANGAAGGAGASGGSCPYTFQMTVSYDALPAASSTATSAATGASSSSTPNGAGQ